MALFVADLDAAARFYVDLLGFEVEWKPDDDNLYLTSGADNLALHRGAGEPAQAQRLDHIGIVVRQASDVDAWHEFLQANNVEMIAAPKTHRDGARSFYCRDPEGIAVQIIHHPPISEVI